MPFSSPRLQPLLSRNLHGRRSTTANNAHRNISFTIGTTSTTRCCSAIAIDAPSSLAEAPAVRWGSVSLQGPREEMEDDLVVRSDGLQGFFLAAVFDIGRAHV